MNILSQLAKLEMNISSQLAMLQSFAVHISTVKWKLYGLIILNTFLNLFRCQRFSCHKLLNARIYKFVALKVHACFKKAFTCSRMIWWRQIKLSLFSATALILGRWMTIGLKKNPHLISYLEHSRMCSLNHFVSISFWQLLLKVSDGTRNTNRFQWLTSFLGILLIFNK